MTDLKRYLITSWYPFNKNDADLAKLLEVDESLVCKWLNGIIEPTIERKIQIAKALKIDSRLIFPADMDLQHKNKYKTGV